MLSDCDGKGRGWGEGGGDEFQAEEEANKGDIHKTIAGRVATAAACSFHVL